MRVTPTSSAAKSATTPVETLNRLAPAPAFLSQTKPNQTKPAPRCLVAILHYDTTHPGAMGLWRPEMINLMPLLLLLLCRRAAAALR